MLTRRVISLSSNVRIRDRPLRWSQRTLLANAARSEPWQQQLGVRGFRASAPRKHPFFYAVLASLLKSSATMELARWTARAVFTFVPLFWIKTHWTQKYLKRLEHHKGGTPEFAQKQERLQRTIRKLTLSYRTMIAIPFALFGLTFLASLERTPLSGRWRVILLSPEEEDTISAQLQGEGWYQAVNEVISADGAPHIIPPSDWRYQVVESVFRQLEATIPLLAREKRAYDLPWLDRGPDEVPLPPPARYPLRPRPAAKEYLRMFCDKFCDKSPERPRAEPPLLSGEAPHLISGPPYNLVLVDRPDCDNAFSFGFGPNGGGGIVVYSGFLDRVFARRRAAQASESTSQKPVLAGFLGSILPSTGASYGSPSDSRAPCVPTEEERTQLAILLSHELSHLILAHHLESLSAGTVFIPGTVAIFADFLRAILFPFTMAFGPFVNDAVANLGKVGSGEFEKLSEYCTSVTQEFEADAVSARILAHAGYDARKAVDFWETRRANIYSECSPGKSSQHSWDLESSLLVTAPTSGANEDMGVASKVAGVGVRLAKRIVGATHPAHEARLLRLKSELQRWETERKRVLRRKRMKRMWQEHWASFTS